MTHRAKERQIFALLDNRLSSRARTILMGHVESCPACRECLERTRRLRALVVDAGRIAPPDWGPTDQRLERAIAELVSKPRPESRLIPLALSFAAAAAVALAVFLSGNLSGPRPRPIVVKSTPAHLARPLGDARRLPASVSDALGRDGQTLVGEEVAEHDDVAAGDAEGVRLALGNLVRLELLASSRIRVLSLDAETPALALAGGRLLAGVPEQSLSFERGLYVLSGGASFNVLYGLAELRLEGGEPGVRVIDGETIADFGFGPVLLGPGDWTLASVIAAEAASMAGGGGSRGIGDPNTPLVAPLEERQVKSLGGRVSRRIIDETMERAKPQLRDCYEQALKRDPGLILVLDVLIRVGERGTVESVRPRGLTDHPEMKRCFVEAIRSLTFPPPPGGSLELILPLRLYPG